MSKTRRPNNKKGHKAIAVRVKFKAGGRKNRTAIEQMSNKELLEAIENPSRRRDLPKYVQVAHKRNIALVA